MCVVSDSGCSLLGCGECECLLPDTPVPVSASALVCSLCIHAVRLRQGLLLCAVAGCDEQGVWMPQCCRTCDNVAKGGRKGVILRMCSNQSMIIIIIIAPVWTLRIMGQRERETETGRERPGGNGAPSSMYLWSEHTHTCVSWTHEGLCGLTEPLSKATPHHRP